MLKIAHMLAASVVVISTCTTAFASREDEKVTTASEQKDVAVTIYNDDLALVKDTRRVGLARDFNRLAWRDVFAHIRPETAQLRNLTHPAGFWLQEQNFDFDLLTPEKLLEKYLGKEITVIRTNPATGEESWEAALVLATNNGAVLKYADCIESGDPGRIRFAFPGVPENLRDKPTLVVSLINPVGGEQNLELSYLTSGLSWRADYVAELNERDDRLDLNGWVTLTNQSGTAYRNARLQLVAGDVNRIPQPPSPSRRAMGMAKMADVEEMKQESLFEYHLYTLQRPTTLAENQTKQVSLMSATSVPMKKEFLLAGADYYFFNQYDDNGKKQKIGVFVEFQNKGDGLGIPLPQGIVRVYKKDSAGNAQFVGEDRIDHTPGNETSAAETGGGVRCDRREKTDGFPEITGGRASFPRIRKRLSDRAEERQERTHYRGDTRTGTGRLENDIGVTPLCEGGLRRGGMESTGSGRWQDCVKLSRTG